MLASVQYEKGKFKKINTENKNNTKAAKFLKHLLQFPSFPVKSVLDLRPRRGGVAPHPDTFPGILFLLFALFCVIEATFPQWS